MSFPLCPETVLWRRSFFRERNDSPDGYFELWISWVFSWKGLLNLKRPFWTKREWFTSNWHFNALPPSHPQPYARMVLGMKLTAFVEKRSHFTFVIHLSFSVWILTHHHHRHGISCDLSITKTRLFHGERWLSNNMYWIWREEVFVSFIWDSVMALCEDLQPFIVLSITVYISLLLKREHQAKLVKMGQVFNSVGTASPSPSFRQVDPFCSFLNNSKIYFCSRHYFIRPFSSPPSPNGPFSTRLSSWSSPWLLLQALTLDLSQKTEKQSKH